MPLSYKLNTTLTSQTPITTIDFSPDSVYIALANENGDIFVVKSSDGAIALSLQRKNTDISCIVWTGLCHEEFLFADSDGYLSTVSFHEGGLMKVSFSPL